MRCEVLEKGEQSLIEKEAGKKESGQIFGEARYNNGDEMNGRAWKGGGWYGVG